MLDTQKVEALRKKLGLSQDEAASRAGLAGRQVWNDIVQGRRKNITLGTLDRIAGVLNVDPRELLK